MPSFRFRLRRPVLVLGALLTAAAPSGASVTHAAEAPAQETIVFLRHGEKPEAGLGQLNCKGLNRSLALPAVLSDRFGRPDAIFAPDPSKRKDDSGTLYDYVRPLATIEPAAIAAGLPVDTTFGYDEIAGLQAALSLPKYRGALIVVAWEHKQIDALVGRLLQDNGGDPKTMPKTWKGKDFDSLYIVRINHAGTTPSATFEAGKEGLDGVADACPAK